MYKPKHLYYHTMTSHWKNTKLVPDEKMYGFFYMAYFSGFFLVFLIFDFLFAVP